MDQVIAEYIKMGFLGVTIVALGWYIIKRDKEHTKALEHKDELHKQEREEFRKTTKEQFDKLVEIQADSVSLLTGIKTMLETINRK